MRAIRKKKDLQMVILMITDVLLDCSQLLYVGDENAIQQAFDIQGDEDNCVFLPQVMSRKKQVIPMLSALWG